VPQPVSQTAIDGFLAAEVPSTPRDDQTHTRTAEPKAARPTLDTETLDRRAEEAQANREAEDDILIASRTARAYADEAARRAPRISKEQAFELKEQNTVRDSKPRHAEP